VFLSFIYGLELAGDVVSFALGIKVQVVSVK
jgi:hypothetical protein